MGVLDFSLLIQNLRQRFEGTCEMQLGIVNDIVSQCPELNEPITDLSKLESYKPHIKLLFILVFPTIFWENNKIAILMPASITPVHTSPDFRNTFLDQDGKMNLAPSFDKIEFKKKRMSRLYMHILEQLYQVKTRATQNDRIILPVVDHSTGLELYYLLDIDMRFVKVTSKQPLSTLSKDTIKEIKRNITDPDRIQSKLPIDQFEISGITIVHAADITQSYMLSMIQNDLIDRDNVSTHNGFIRLQNRLRIYFNRPNLVASLASIYDDQILLLNTGCDLKNSCMFTSSRQFPISHFKGTPFEDSAEKKEIFVFSDIHKYNLSKFSKKTMDGAEIRSLMICPLIYRDEYIGTLDLGDPETGVFGTHEMIKVEEILPLFAMAINRAIEDLDNEVQGIIKEKCTAVHPSVEWKFRKATLNYISELQADNQAELAPIIFKDVYPLYGIADVRGSTNARNHSIQQDLDTHLKYVKTVLEEAAKEKDMLIFRQLLGQIDDERTRIQKGLASGDELTTVKFIQNNIENVFSHIRDFSPKVAQAIDDYDSHIDKHLGTVYQLRKEFEESIFLLNQRLANFLDTEQNSIQKVYPHFYERHRTDGVDYLIYIGKSMNEKGKFHELYVKNLHLWQLHIACGMAWLTQHLKPELSVPLDTAHLILVQNSALSIRFRYDEKQFDVDGAYDIRHEIIKSRIDKAEVKGTKERLTQPHRIAIVYSMMEEKDEMLQHIRYLQKQTFLKQEIEFLDLEDLPGVTGLKALRVGIVMNSPLIGRWMENYFS
ncbi:MAG: hypothetical protein OMM_10848 [Candidatus Magnetoglobus multicellularis str. Araruama]|uniref:GAF domain-containing protein n=1 Tax=Candidatus Magnetoglobus multicellularis str. Araruama TaxID=890399 RepID=A0A1V1NZU5_9BACT|nr:MAG: hypothetical protein OMM_10848 [Candidatus Magnetoglobus multicellularis str. Araruama]